MDYAAYRKSTAPTGSTILLGRIARELSEYDGATWTVERLGGNVYGATAFDGTTVTIDGGQREADAGREPVELLVCRDGYPLFRGGILTAREVPPIVAAVAPVHRP